jgi:hypothetical protein
MSSERKAKANRRNALKSTDPKSPEGKARSSRNAVTHILCSRKVLLPNEDPQRMRAQLAALRRDLKPARSARRVPRRPDGARLAETGPPRSPRGRCL